MNVTVPEADDAGAAACAAGAVVGVGAAAAVVGAAACVGAAAAVVGEAADFVGWAGAWPCGAVVGVAVDDEQATSAEPAATAPSRPMIFRRLRTERVTSVPSISNLEHKIHNQERSKAILLRAKPIVKKVTATIGQKRSR